MESKPLNILVCGGGNATHVIAGLAGRHENCKVSIFDIVEKEVKGFQEGIEKFGGITVKHGNNKYFGKVHKAVQKCDEVAKDADVIFISIPAFVHEEYFK